MIKLELPWPPSVNHYKDVGSIVTTKKGKLYQVRTNSAKTKRFYYEVWMKVRKMQPLDPKFALCATIPIGVSIDLHPPDKRRRDIDNPIKPIFDSLVKANVIYDDSQIVRLLIQRCPIIPRGLVIVRIYEMEPQP